jgi:hypothetical protein
VWRWWWWWWWWRRRRIVVDVVVDEVWNRSRQREEVLAALFRLREI